MSGFEPGEGWREVTGTSDMDKAVLVNYEDPKSRGWVRVPPMPPLPTEPYTVIRVTWADRLHGAPSDWAKLTPGYWQGRFGYFQSDGELQRRITGFEVLAEPHIVRTYLMEEQRQALRRETAMAVLDRVRECWTGDERINDIAREFGVDQ